MEYLIKVNGKYELIESDVVPNGGIEVPEGATLRINDLFYKIDDSIAYVFNFEKWKPSIFNVSELLNSSITNWKRQQPHLAWESIKNNSCAIFIDDEPNITGDECYPLTEVDATLKARQSTYGDFKNVARTTGELMAVINKSVNGEAMPCTHHEALHMICSKIARILNGDYNHKDSWHDIQGYAKLVEDSLD